MRISLFALSFGILILAGCAKAEPIVFEEEVVAPVQTVETEEPTFDPEIPATLDDEIVTQPDTSL